MSVRAGLLACESRCVHRLKQRSLPVCTVASRQTLAYSCAAARDLHPLPCSVPAAERANSVNELERTNRGLCPRGTLTLSGGRAPVNAAMRKIALPRTL